MCAEMVTIIMGVWDMLMILNCYVKVYKEYLIYINYVYQISLL